MDCMAAVLVLLAVYGLLLHYSDLLGEWISQLLGRPFRMQGVTHLRESAWLFPIMPLCLFLGLVGMRFYALELFTPMRRVALAALKGVLLGLGFCTLFLYVFTIVEVNRSLLLGFFAGFACYHLPKEWVWRRWVLERRLKSRPLRALVVAVEQEYAALEACLRQGSIHRALQVEHLGSAEGLSAALSEGGFDLVVLGSRVDPQEVIGKAEEQGVEVWYFAEYAEAMLSRPQLDSYGGKPVVVFSTIPHYEGKFLIKRLCDVLGAVVLGLVLAPLLVGCALAILAAEGRPVFYRQQRTGWRGRSFAMLKFRTMSTGAEALRAALEAQNEHKGPVFKAEEDPRITRVGRWLRRYSLDELPQLWNVLRGEMSLVGPRPLPVEETRRFACFRDRRRLSVLPGITGLWQVSGRSDIEDFADWVRLDLDYIDRWSLWLDFRILARTVPVVLSGKGAR